MTDTILKRATLIVRDAARMKEFYETVLGWTCSYDAAMKLSGPAPQKWRVTFSPKPPYFRTSPD